MRLRYFLSRFLTVAGFLLGSACASAEADTPSHYVRHTYGSDVVIVFVNGVLSRLHRSMD